MDDSLKEVKKLADFKEGRQKLKAKKSLPRRLEPTDSYKRWKEDRPTLKLPFRVRVKE